MSAAAVQRAHLKARFEAGRAALLHELVPLDYERPAEGLPAYVRSAPALLCHLKWEWG